MKTTARLSSTLRRLLDARAAAHRVRLASVLHDIKLAALELRGKAPQDCILSPITDLELSSPLARTFWKPSITFDDQTLSEHVVDISRVQQVAGAFAKLQRLDFRKLRGVIREYTHDGSSIRLSDLVDQQPLTSGVVEVLGYLQLAHDDGHEIDRFETDTITVKSTHASESASGDLSRGIHAFNAASRIKVRVPRVTFLPKSRTKTIGRQPR